MRVIVAGAGEVGWNIAKQISADGHDVTIIDNNEGVIDQVSGGLGVRAMFGRVASITTLREAGVAKADIVLAFTGNDEANIVCASISRQLGAKRVLARVAESIHLQQSQLSYSEHFGIDDLISPETLAAQELAAYVRNPSALAIEHFARGALEVQQVVAGGRGRYIGKSIRDMGLPQGVRVASIKRGKEFIIPTGNVAVQSDDIVTIIGTTEQVTQARGGFEVAKQSSQKVVIVGGGHIGLSLARRLRSHNFNITIIEERQSRCQELAVILDDVTVLHGDGTSQSFVKQERIENADVFVTTTADDRDNIMSGLQAKELGVKIVLVIINSPDYRHLVTKMGINHVVSPRAVMTAEILSILRKGKASTRASLDGGNAEILELAVEGQDFVGQRLRSLDMPAGALVLTLQRGTRFMVPKGDDTFQLGDTVLVICRHDHRKEVIKLVSG